MRKNDTVDVLASSLAVVCDGLAVFGGFGLAIWNRFDSGWFNIARGRPADLYAVYLTAAAFAALLVLVVFQSLGLFVRPQIGSFLNRIPRLVRAVASGVVLSMVLAFSAKNEVDISRGVIGISFFTISFLVLLERYILFRIEWNHARHSRHFSRVLILGTDSIAAHVKRALLREPMLRARVVGFLRTDDAPPDPGIPPDAVKGAVDELDRLLDRGEVDRVILTGSQLGQKRTLDLVRLCERNLIEFNMVPDLFRVMTTSMDVQSLDDIPLLGLSPWPLDCFWNRAIKRIEDVAGAAVGLVLAAPVIAAAGLLIKRASPGPVFFRQERCGEGGAPFMLYKLRTMVIEAEDESGPVFAVPNDPRTTPVGGFLRRFNVDELPQLWNVLKGEMSLVGPRPERPHFVEQFRSDFNLYMRRHVSKPGMTGWAQVNGLRGNTSIEERVKYDLYYLENWSLAFDFKILLKTVLAKENAY